MSVVNIIFDFASTQKLAKSDASPSVDAFDGVRDGDRIRASGDVLFFHIVKFSMTLSDFCIHGVSKATPVTTKANAF